MCDHKQGTITKVCQMLSRWTKNSLYSTNIQDTVTNVVPLCSVYQAPLYVPNLTLLAWFLPDFAYLCMLFILEVVYHEMHIVYTQANFNQRPVGLYSSTLLFCALAPNVLLKSRPVSEGMNLE